MAPLFPESPHDEAELVPLHQEPRTGDSRTLRLASPPVDEVPRDHHSETTDASGGVRQIGACAREGERLKPSVSLKADHGDPLFSDLRGEGNALKVYGADGRVWRCRGRGAGRWATTESLMGDLAEIVRARRADAGLN